MALRYATVKIPQPIADKVLEIAVQKLGTYRTVSEFVIESTRQHLERIEPVKVSSL
jgi:Arc/MetJ-type ribon-helix-helix transcriptional regulator